MSSLPSSNDAHLDSRWCGATEMRAATVVAGCPTPAESDGKFPLEVLVMTHSLPSSSSADQVESTSSEDQSLELAFRCYCYWLRFLVGVDLVRHAQSLRAYLGVLKGYSWSSPSASKAEPAIAQHAQRSRECQQYVFRS